MLAEKERPPYVTFEIRAVEDRNASIKAGHYVSKDVAYALVTPPGSRDLHEEVLDTWLAKAKMNARNGRLDPKWVDAWEIASLKWKEGQEIPENGIPIKGWTMLSPAQCESLIYANIRTVEDLAAINDEGLGNIGIGGLDLKKKAISWLQATKDHGPLTMKVSQLEQENESLKSENERLKKNNHLLAAQIETGNSAVDEVIQDRNSNVISIADITPDPEPVIRNISKFEELKEQYRQKFGKDPHHLMKEAGLRKKLSE